MSTIRLERLVDFVSQFDGPKTDEAWAEIIAVRRMAKALIDGGVTYGSRNSGAFIDAVRLLEEIAKEAA